MLSDAAVQAASKEAAVLIANRLDEQKTLAPRDRQTLDAVRSALKNLDFNKNEYEPLVARMDPSLGFEKLVKSALKTLREVN
jgi:Holliday junction resolvasome RuvABC DNA-binding subunit